MALSSSSSLYCNGNHNLRRMQKVNNDNIKIVPRSSLTKKAKNQKIKLNMHAEKENSKKESLMDVIIFHHKSFRIH